VTFETIAGLTLAFFFLIYLLYALLRAEKM
jgi:K+-transporting ATPase KdpF subunit